MPVYTFMARKHDESEVLKSELTADNMVDGIDYLKTLGYDRLLSMREHEEDEGDGN